MDKKTYRGIQRQLEQLFQEMADADNFTAAKLLTELCASLLRVSKKLDVDASNLDGDDFENITNSYIGIAQAVSSFAGQIRGRSSAEAERLVQTGGANALAQARTEGDRLRAEALQLKEDLDRQLADNEALSRNLGQKKGEYADSCSRHRRLQDELDAIYPHKLEQQSAENTRLEEELARRADQLQQAQERHGALAARLEETGTRLRQIEEALEAMPAELRQLGEACEEKERYLERLRNAEQEFSPQRQKEVQDEIDALQPEVQALEDAIRALRNTLSNLKEAHTELDRERHTLETDLLERINTCLEELNGISLAHRGELDEVSRQADHLEENLKQCADLRRRYAAWWDADRTPLEIIRGILGSGDPLDNGLSGSLDPAESRRLSDLDDRVKTALEEMDGILSLCFQAMQQDKDSISDKVSKIPRG